MKAVQTHDRNILPPLPQGAGSILKSYSPTQLHFLMRLSHLQRQRRDMVNVADGTDWHMRLVNKALYSTYCDCEDLGVGEEARLLMAQQTPERSQRSKRFECRAAAAPIPHSVMSIDLTQLATGGQAELQASLE